MTELGADDGLDLETLAPAEMLPEPHSGAKRRSPWRVAVAVAGAAALLGVTTIAVTAIGSRGGASSPDGAVRALARAIDAGDPLAAVDVIAPDEVRSLRSTVDTAESKAADLKVVDNASAPLRGVDLQVDHLDLATEKLADGYVKVHIVSGTIAARTNRNELSSKLQRVTDHDASTSVDLAQSHPFDSEPFVVAIRRDGHWYVSAAYTALEYARVANHLPAADYGSGVAAKLGADSPEAAATGFVRALQAHDWPTVFSLIPPSEIPLYDYRADLAQLFDKNDWSFTVSQVSATATVDGDTADVNVTANGTYPAGGRTETWAVANNCLSVSMHDPELGAEGPLRTCLGGDGYAPYGIGFFVPFGIAFGDSPDTASHVRAVQVGGRWFLSPVATAENLVDKWVHAFDGRKLAVLLGDYADIQPDATITLNTATVFHGKGYDVHVFGFDGKKGQRVVGSRAGQASNVEFPNLGAELVGTDGKVLDNGYGLFYSDPVTLPADGVYRLVVTSSETKDYSFTLWDAKDAPKEALSLFGTCPDVGSSGDQLPTATLCSSASSGVIGSNTATANGATASTVVVPPDNGSSVATSSTTPGG